MKRVKYSLHSFLRKMQRRFLPVFLSLIMALSYVPMDIGTTTVWAEDTGEAAAQDLQSTPTPFAEAPAEDPTPAEPTPAEPTPEVTPEAEPTPEVTPEAEPTPEATPEAEPTPEATPEAEPTPEATPEAEPTPEATPGATPEATPTGPADGKNQNVSAEPTPTPEADPSEEDAEAGIVPNSITEDTTTYYEIRFYDEKGTPIQVNSSATGDAQYIQYVKEGGSTQPPHRPVINGNNEKFVGWFTVANGQGVRATDSSFTNITADQSWYAYYTAQPTYTITINYVFANDGVQAADPYVAHVEQGGSYQATVPSPVLEGYTPDQTEVVIDLTDVAEDKTYTVQYTGEVQKYKVEHQLEDLDGETYTTEDTDELEGYIGEYTEAAAKEYEGFTAGAVNNVMITPSTTTDDVTIVIQYTRNTYELVFDTDGGSYIPSKSVKYGRPIKEALNGVGEPTKLGYEWQGWTLSDGSAIEDTTTMPAGRFELKAAWEEDTRAGYTVVYWLENLSGGYDYVTQTTGTGRVGSAITASNLSNSQWSAANIDPAGVQRDTSRETEVTITADGKAVMNVYYSRRTFTVRFYLRSGWNWQEQTSLQISAKYGQDVSGIWTDSAHSRYMWYTSTNLRTSVGAMSAMPAENLSRYGNTADIVTIYYMVEKVNSSDYEQYTTGVMPDGWTINEGDVIDIPGFDYDTMNTRTRTLYYTRNSYTLSFGNCTGVGDATLKYEEVLSNGRPSDRSVQPPAGVDSDYTFGGWYTSPACEDGTEVNWDSTMPSKNLQVYAKWVAPTYTVNFVTNKDNLAYDSITVTKYETIGELPTPEIEGDEFLGWYVDADCTEPFIATRQITDDFTLYAKWKSAYTYAYTIQYVDEANHSIPDSLIPDDAPKGGSGEANTYVTVRPVDIEGYTATSGAFSVLLDMNNKVITVRYTKDATWSFRINYIDINTRQPIIPAVEQEVSASIAQVVVNSPSVNENDAFTGYTIASDPQITVKKEDADAAAAAGSVYTVTFLYTTRQQTYVVYHQLEMPDGTYQTVETEQIEGQVGQYVTADSKAYEGYTCISTALERSGVVIANADVNDPKSGLNIYVKYDRDNSLSISDYSGKYDGAPHGLTVSGDPVNTDLVKEEIQYSTDRNTWSTTPVTQTDVKADGTGDSYTVYTRVVTTANGTTYTGTTETHSIAIQPREVTVTAPNASKIYDGTQLDTFYGGNNYVAAAISGDGFVGDEGFDHFVYTTDSYTYVGTKANKIDQASTLAALKSNTKRTNYTFTFADGTLTVNDRPDEEKYQLTITPHGGNVPYNGQEQSVSGADYVWTDDQDQPLTGYRVEGATFGASGTDAKEYPVVQTGDVIVRDGQNNDVTSQFTVNVEEAKLNISKRLVTIQAGSQSWDYDGDPHSLNESSVASGSLADGHTYTATVTGTVQAQGESADNVISDIRIFDANSNEVTANYDITPVNGRLVINAIDGDITAVIQIAAKETTYNGGEQKFSELTGDDYTVSFSGDGLAGLDTSGWTIAGTTITTAQTNAGTYTVMFADRSKLQVLDKEGNPVTTAQFNVTPGQLKINPAKITITAGSDKKEYDGTPLTVSAYEVGGDNGLQGNDTLTARTSGSQLSPGKSDNVIDETSVNITNASGTSVIGNYEISYGTGTLEVTNDGKADRVITITANGGEQVYNGEPLTNDTYRIAGESLNGFVDRSSLRVSGSQTDVGIGDNEIVEDSVKIMNNGTDVTEAYTINCVKGSLEVTPRPITLTGATLSKPYDGQPLTAPGVTLTGSLAATDEFESEPQATGTVTNVDKVENPVGDVKIVDKVSGEDKTANYTITRIPGELEITPASADLNAVSIVSAELTYDADPHELDAATSLVTDGTTIYYTTVQNPGEDDWSTEMPSFTDVGTYTVYVKAVNANYEDAPTSGTLTIKRRQVVITGNNDTLPYNGDTQTVEGYTAAQAAPGSDTGLLGGHTVEGATAAASAKNVGTRIPGTITDAGAVTITADGADVTKNYDIVTRPGWITITPLTIKVESKGGEQRYSGQPLRVAEAEITDGALAGSDTITYNFTGGQTNIGSSANTFTAIIRSGEESANDNYTIQYEYGTLTVYGEISYAANGGTGEAPDPDRYDSGDRYEVKENSFFTREGYTFTGWNTRANGQGTPYAPGNAITNLATGNLTLYAQWTANTDTRYTVETYLEGEDGTYPSAASTSEEREGTTDTTVSVSEADKTAPEGYALDPEADNVFEGIVKGDGSLVLKIYFARDAKGGGDDGDEPDDIPDRYQLVFRYVANANGSVSGTVTEVHTFGNETDGYTRPTATTPDAAVAAAADPGYHILGWTDEASEDLGDGEAPDFGGLTYRVDQTFTVSFEEDGNITIQYKADGHGTVSRDSESLAPATGTAQGSVAAAETGYHFDGWYLGENKVGDQEEFVPSKNGEGVYETATYVAKFAPDEDTAYKIDFYYTDDNGDYPDIPARTDERSGTTDTQASVTDADKQPEYEGYILDTSADNVFEGNIAGDGSLVLKVYFAKDVKGGGDDGDEPDDIPDRYQLVFRYVANANGSVSGTVTEVHTFGNADDGYTRPTATTPDAAVTAAPNAGYHIAGWTDEASEDLGTAPKPLFDGRTYTTDQTFTVSFVENDDVTINYEAEANGSVSRDSETLAPATGTAQGSVATPDAGYHLDGWYLEDTLVSTDLNFVPDRNADGIYEAATYVAKFAPEEQTPYTVNYYYTDDDGNYPADDAPTYQALRNGVTDTQASVTDQDKIPVDDGYVLDPSAGNVFSGNIAGDGSLVLKVYFAKDAKGGGDDGDEPDDIPDRYQIVFRYVAEENGSVAGTLTEVHTFGNETDGYTLPVPTTPNGAVEAKGDPGYHILAWVDEAAENLGAETAPVFGDHQYDTDQTFTVSFEENDDITINYVAEDHGSVTVDSETLAPATGTAKGSVAEPETGYHLDGWYLGETKVGSDETFVPSRNGDGIYEEATYTAKFAPDTDTPYQVEFYYEGEGGYPEEATSVSERFGTTDTQASVTDTDKIPTEDGYVLDVSADNVFSGNIAGDGSLVLKVYFAIDNKGGGEDGEEPDDIPDYAQIIFRYVIKAGKAAEANGTLTGQLTEVHTFGDAESGYTKPAPTTPDAAVTAKANAGYHIAGWVDEASEDLGAEAAPVFGERQYDTDQTFAVSFTENDDITIKYEAEEHGSVSRDEETLAPATGEAKGSVAKPDKGYHLVGWYLDDELVSEDLNFLPSRNDSGVYEEATYVAKFAPEEQTLYTVEFYYADDDGTYPGKPERTAQRNGVTDTEVSVTDADKTPAAGYMLDESADNVFSGTIKGDGSLVLKLYFTKDAIGGGDDGNEPDGIPDFAQIIFRYVAKEHGSVSGTTVEVRTFRDAAGNYTRPTAVTPYAAVEAEPDAGYVVDVWSDEDGNEFGSQAAPAISSTYDRSMTFYVTFKTADGKKVSGTNTTGTTRTRRTPKTGDETALGLWLALAANAAAGSCGILYKRRKKKS